MSENVQGRVVQVIGPVVDVEFPEDHLPAILNAVHIKDSGELGEVAIDITAEVAQHLGENRARCVSMQATDGVVRGMPAVDLGEPISVPVGRKTLGRVLNVLGEPVDGKGPVEAESRQPIHREAPPLSEQSTESRCSRPASRSSTSWSRTPRAARPACSAAPASARRCSSRS
jgi:F-type H+-transporting ATPase subunit beta